MFSCLGFFIVYCVNFFKVCYFVCDSVIVLIFGWVGCGGDFIVNFSYRICIDFFYNYSDVIIKYLISSYCDIIIGGGRGDGGDFG